MGQRKYFKDGRYAPNNILRIAETHIDRYENLIRIGSSETHVFRNSVDLVECKGYLALWKSIEGKAGIWELLTDAEQGEVNDALFDQDPEDVEIDA